MGTMSSTVAYTFYTDTYGGTLAEDTFLRHRVHATALLRQYTGGRAEREGVDESAVSLALCALCDALERNEQGGGIASESNDGVSVSYVAGVSKAKTDDGRLFDAAMRFLGTSGLLYRGED